LSAGTQGDIIELQLLYSVTRQLFEHKNSKSGESIVSTATFCHDDDDDDDDFIDDNYRDNI
jgi:hypothetical protein